MSKYEDNITDWVFHFNIHTEKWEAAKRENYNELFSGDEGNVIKSSSVDTLIQLIEKTDGDVDKLRKLTRQDDGKHK